MPPRCWNPFLFSCLCHKLTCYWRVYLTFAHRRRQSIIELQHGSQHRAPPASPPPPPNETYLCASYQSPRVASIRLTVSLKGIRSSAISRGVLSSQCVTSSGRDCCEHLLNVRQRATGLTWGIRIMFRGYVRGKNVRGGKMNVEEEEEMESYRLVINLGFFFRLWPSWSTWHKSDLLILTCYIVSTFFRIVHNPATVRACACMCTRACVCLHLFAFVCVYVHISLRVHVCLFSFV